MQNLKIFNQLMSGRYPLSLKEILNYHGGCPLYSAMDYYQSGKKGEKPTQILLRAGVDLKKKEKYLDRMMNSESAYSDSKNPKFVCDESGKKAESLYIEVSPATVSFFKELTKKV